jgi:hypothetical protein
LTVPVQEFTSLIATYFNALFHYDDGALLLWRFWQLPLNQTSREFGFVEHFKSMAINFHSTFTNDIIESPSL